MLKQRVITALVLVAILLPCLLVASPWPFAVLTLLFIGAAGWEWARLNGGRGAGAILLGLAVAAAGAATLWSGWLGAPQPPAFVGPLAALTWVLGGALVLRRGGAGWGAWPVALRWVIGAVLLWLAWAAMTRAKLIGLNFLLSVFCLVWAADIAAYFGGRRFGRRKLAPAISPGKSWEGVWSGLVGTWVLAALWMAVERQALFDSPSLYTLLLRQFGAFGLLLSLSFLAAISVVGDLVESLVKRQAGAKDSSRLLPGHGGVLDRIDALLPVFPVALYLVSLGA